MAAAAFAPWLPKSAEGAYAAGDALGKLEAAQPLKNFVNQGGASFFESATNALGGASLEIKSITGGPALDLSRKSGAFGANLDMQLLPKIAQQLVQSALAEAAAADKVAAARSSWVSLLKEGRAVQQQVMQATRAEEQIASDAARKRLATAAAARGTVFAPARFPGMGDAGNNPSGLGQFNPAGNTMTAQPGYRAMLNARAATGQAAEAVRAASAAKTQLGFEAQMLRTSTSVLAVRDKINNELQQSVDIARERNKVLMEEYKAQQRVAAGQLDPASLRASRKVRVAEGRKRQEQFGSKAESIALGVGFPLMFGAGGGSILGSLAGSFAGQGFGGQILGGAIGAMFDQFAAAAADMGASLRDPITNFQKIADAGLLASKSQEYYIQRLIEVGQVSKAAAVIQEELVRKVGISGVNDLQRLGAASDKLSKAWAELNLQMQAAIAGPLADLLAWVSALVGEGNKRREVGAKIEDVRRGLSGKALEEFNKKEQDILRQWNVNKLGGISNEEVAKRRAALAAEYEGRAKPTAVTGTTLSPEVQQQAAEARLGAAERAEALRRQGIQQENQAIDLRRNLEEQVYGFRQRAADMERANIDLRRSVEDEIFSKRQEIARQEIDNDRKRAQLAIERTDLGLAGMRGFSNEPGQEIANRLLDATREYIRARGEGEADLRAKERTFTVEVEDLKRASEKLRFEVGRKVADLQRQANDYTRDVEKARFSAERAIYDLQISAADYRVAKAKEAITLETEAASRLQMTQGLTANVSGGGNLGSGAYPLTSQRGPRWGRQHHGIDYDAPNGTPISTTLGGKVSSSGYEAGYGNWVEVKLENGVKAFWAHLSAVVLKEGQAFNAGQVIAKTGNTGRSTGPHLHSGHRRIGNAGDAYTLLGGQVTAAANNIVPTAGVAAPRSVDTSSAMAGLNSLSAPGAVGVGDLLAQFAKFDAQLIRTKGQALELDKAFAQMTDVQRQQAFQQAIAQTVQELNAPIDALLSTQQDQLAYQREYGALVQEGMLPALAEQILKIREQVTLELQKVDFAVLQYKTQIEYLKSKGLETTELEKQLAILEAQRDIIEGKGKQAEEGAKEAESPGQRLQGAYDKIRGELNALTDPVNQVIAGANAIGEAFGQAFAGLVSGSMTAKEALRSFFQSTAQHFIDMASQMIAKYIQMKIIGLVLNAIGGAAGGAFSGGTSSAVDTGAGGWGDAFNTQLPGISGDVGRTPIGFAEGGYVTSATPAVFGEAGPEYAIPASKMGAAMANYSAGKRGAAVLDDTGGGSAAGGGGGAGGGTFTLETVVINNIEYATVAQVREMGQAAAKQGADGGHSRVMGDFRNKRSVRSRVGMR